MPFIYLCESNFVAISFIFSNRVRDKKGKGSPKIFLCPEFHPGFHHLCHRHSRWALQPRPGVSLPPTCSGGANSPWESEKARAEIHNSDLGLLESLQLGCRMNPSEAQLWRNWSSAASRGLRWQCFCLAGMPSGPRWQPGSQSPTSASWAGSEWISARGPWPGSQNCAREVRQEQWPGPLHFSFAPRLGERYHTTLRSQVGGMLRERCKREMQARTVGRERGTTKGGHLFPRQTKSHLGLPPCQIFSKFLIHSPNIYWIFLGTRHCRFIWEHKRQGFCLPGIPF